MQMNRSDLLLRKRNAPEQRQKRGCRGSTELPIVVPRRSWREISCGKLGTLIQQTKNSLNFVSTCLKVVDTRRNAGTPPVSTDDATVAETLSTRSVVDLPLNGRDALKLAATTSDVIVGPKSNQTAVPPGEDFIGAGQREITNSLTLDGITIMNNRTVTNVQPNVDAVEEVQVQSGNYTAQYGSYMGVHGNLATHSGPN